MLMTTGRFLSQGCPPGLVDLGEPARLVPRTRQPLETCYPLYTLCQFPIRTDRKFIDQCARGLSILGLPNFYFQDQSQLVESKTLAAINGSKFCGIEGQIPGASKSFFKDKHIQCLISWLFCDEQNETLSQFHVVPVPVSAEVKFLFEGNAHDNNAIVYEPTPVGSTFYSGFIHFFNRCNRIKTFLRKCG
jgi:hypothetical protein